MYQGLGFDPTPGEPSAVTQAITQLTAAADALAEVEPALRRAAERSQAWQGAAAEAFRARLHDSPDDRVEPRLRHAAAALDRWAGVLTANKRRAEELDTQAARLRKRLETARDLLADQQNARDLAGTGAAAAGAEADLASVSTLIADLESALDEVLATARTLERDHQRTADAIADELAGGEIPAPATESAVGRVVAEALRTTSRTSGALAGLLLPAGAAASVPTGAAGALAAALSASDPR
jgi:chromosome segregation ATPase